MASQAYNSNYLIQHSALSIKLGGNSYVTGTEASEYIAVSCLSGTRIALSNTISLRGMPGSIEPGYSEQLSYNTWVLSAYNTKFASECAALPMYVYARIERAGGAALVVFSKNNYDYDGGVITAATAEEQVQYLEAKGDSTGRFTIIDDQSYFVDGGTIMKRPLTPASESYYYMQLGVISAPDSSHTRSWLNNLSGWEGLDLGQLDTPLSAADKTMFEWYNGMISPLQPFAAIDLEGNMIWRGTTLYGPFTKSGNVLSALQSGREYVPTLSAVDENFVAKYRNDSNNHHRLELGQLVVRGRETEQDAVYYDASTDYVTYAGLTYLKSTMHLVLPEDVVTIDGIVYLKTTVTATTEQVDDGEGGTVEQTTYTAGDNSVETHVGAYVPYVTDASTGVVCAPIEYATADVETVNGVKYIRSTLYAVSADGVTTYYTTPESVSVREDSGTYVIVSELAPTATNIRVAQVYSNAKEDVDDGTSRDLATFDHLLKDNSGAGVWRDESGFIHMETDFMSVHNKLTAKEVEIEELNYVGGCIVLSPADGFRTEVVRKVRQDGTDESGNAIWTADDSQEPEAYMLMWRNSDSSGTAVKNTWRLGDQATAQSFNLDGTSGSKPGFVQNEELSSTFWWRVVIGVGSITENTEVSGSTDGNKTETSVGYNYIVVSNDTMTKTDATYKDAAGNEHSVYQYVCEGSDVPAEDETVVMVGHQTYPQAASAMSYRENVIILQSSTSTPYIREYTRINSLQPVSDTQLAVNIEPGNNIFKGSVTVESWDWDDESSRPEWYNTLYLQYQALLDKYATLSGVGNNYIRNSDFAGDYLSTQIDGDRLVTSGTETYSDPFSGWSASGATAAEDESLGCTAVTLADGTLTQALDQKPAVGEAFSFSLYGYGGSVTVRLGDAEHTFDLMEGDVSEQKKWNGASSSVSVNTVTVTGSGTVTKLMLNTGATAQPWCKSMMDNANTLTYYSNLHYLMEAMKNGRTTTYGGLVLTDLLQVGEWNSETDFTPHAGMNGIVSTADETPAFWAGGTQGEAVRTIRDYNDLYPDKPDTPSGQVPFTVTHSGRVIMNDAVVRGKVFADSGEFKGSVYASEGAFDKGTIKNGWLNNMTLSGPLVFNTKYSYSMHPSSSEGQTSIICEATDLSDDPKTHRIIEYGMDSISVRGAGYKPFLYIGDKDDSYTGASEVDITSSAVMVLNKAGSYTNIGPADIQLAPNGDSNAHIRLFFIQDGDNYVPHLEMVDSKGNVIHYI